MISRRLALVIVGLSAIGLVAWRTGANAYLDKLFQSKEYIEACRTAEVRFIRKPSAPVRSVALDYLPHTTSEPRRRYELNADGRVERVGTLFWQPRVEQQIERFELRTQYGKDKPEWQFYRYEGQVPPFFVGARSAEVLVMDTISHSEELLKPLWEQGMVEHRLKVTDLRNGDELAEMSYVVDLKSKRACGGNTHAAIDVDLFILQAVAAPIVIPEYERQRRERAVLKNW